MRTVRTSIILIISILQILSNPVESQISISKLPCGCEITNRFITPQTVSPQIVLNQSAAHKPQISTSSHSTITRYEIYAKSRNSIIPVSSTMQANSSTTNLRNKKKRRKRRLPRKRKFKKYKGQCPTW